MDVPGLLFAIDGLGLWEWGFAACVGLLFLSCFGLVCAGLDWALRRWQK